MSAWTRLCLAIVASALSATMAFAQGVQTGTMQGTAVDTQGGVLPGVLVTASSPALQGVRTATTDENGVYLIRGLPAGEYTVEVRAVGLHGRRSARDRERRLADARSTPRSASAGRPRP